MTDADAELALAHILLVAPHEQRASIFATVAPADFATADAAALAGAVLDIWSAHKAVDTATLVDTLTRSNELILFGGVSGIAKLLQTRGVAVANATLYAQRVRDSASRRRFVATIDNLQATIKNDGVPVHDAIGSAMSRLSECLQRDVQQSTSIADVLNAHVEALQADRGGRYVETGIRSFDSLFGGLPRGLVAVGARPGVGKSSLCIQIAKHVSRSAPVLIISIEMTKEEVIDVALAQESGVASTVFRAPMIDADALARIVDAASSMANHNRRLHIQVPTRASVHMIRAIALQHRHVHGQLGLLVVDYLQRVKGDAGIKYGSREQEVSYIATALADLAKELGCCVLTPCAINREMTRTNRKPSASDLRESGGIESDAHMVILVHRPEVTSGDVETSEIPASPELIVGKHRGGPIGAVPVHFDGPAQLFSESRSGRF